jgi:hypothetical protein
VLVVAADRPTLDNFATCDCNRSQRRPHNLSPRRIFVGHDGGGEFFRFAATLDRDLLGAIAGPDRTSDEPKSPTGFVLWAAPEVGLPLYGVLLNLSKNLRP